MATITKRGGAWLCQVRRRGYPARSKTFQSRADAEKWGRLLEAEMDRGVHLPNREAEGTTLADLLDRYLTEVSPKKRSGNSDPSRVAAVKKRLGAYKLTALTPQLLAEYRDEKLRTLNPQTVIHHLALINRALTLATREWGIVLPGGVPKVVKPKLPPGRDRRVQQGELDAIIAATESPVLADLIPFAVETGMRRGEMLALDWEYIDFDRRTAYLPKTKTDTPRTVPLSTKALAILQRRQEAGEGVPFAMQEDAVTTAFMRAVRRARAAYEAACVAEGKSPSARWLVGIRLHDLRHEATSRFFEKGLSVMEVTTITGHKTMEMLKRYTHLRAQDVALKLG
ncbi:site-specific integrase [Ralstonia pseudosolanacearum]|uniref:site-specific integrase n=1 Tax=Ralstonia pseudosolanacearum TaxID=1310165 RepID=UPI000E580A0C|nr:site-specific integrase [Ralstonia pseudosolanacearum]AXW10431.1 integrase [Ralstonia solanacearum]AXW33317.1 integrase [Ralstonia solanacearum]AXW43014.1 integrase [Ralstonia solanacearum]AXW48254.1 integrase [Ralstonia solanacearum]AXW66337.1 integrase [Ralstonia solanacearum]